MSGDMVGSMDGGLGNTLGIKRRAVGDDAGRRAWGEAHPWCMVCGDVGGASIEDALHTHHLLGGKHGRSDEPCNYLRAHERCHRLCHGELIRTKFGPLPKLSLAMQLTLKRERDPESWNPVRLAELRAPWSLPRLEPAPEYFTGRWQATRARRLAAGWREPEAISDPTPTLRMVGVTPSLLGDAKLASDRLQVSVEEFCGLAIRHAIESLDAVS